MISCIVNNIGQYINFIEHHFKGMWNYFYRGEDNDFKNTKLTASFYRGKSKKNGVKYYYNTWSTFLNASQSFYRNLPNINKNESRNFMELCQHHAIPTPLLDISSSPLIALYFASQNRNTDGHVYIFNKNIFIPFTNDILSYKYLNKCFHNHHFPLDFHKIINIKLLIKSIRTSMFYSNVNQTNSITKLINETIYDVEGHLKKDFLQPRVIIYV